MNKPIKGYEKFYEISNDGRVFSCERKVKIKNRHGSCFITIKRRELNQGRNSDDYFIVKLCKKGECKTHIVSRLVAQAFIINPSNLPEVNHKDTNKHNNNDWNLEWVTKKQNIQHASKNGLLYKRKGEKNPGAKLTNEDVFKIRDSFLTQKELAERFKVSQTTISDIVLGKSWQHI